MASSGTRRSTERAVIGRSVRKGRPAWIAVQAKGNGMDNQRFEAMVKRLAFGATRRRVVSGVFGGLGRDAASTGPG